MPRPYVRLRETTFDLYVERDLLPGYYKLVSITSSWLVLAGYILFAIDFTSTTEDLKATRDLLTAVASGLLVVGYAGIVTVALLGRSLLYLIDGVITPTLTASLLGLFVTIANFLLHVQIPTNQVYMSVPLVTSCVTTVVSAIILAVAYRELGRIRKRDERRRWHLQLGPYVGGGNDPTSVLGIPGPDDEAQRRQLMRLLQDRQESILNQEEINNSYRTTFKVELKPDERERENRYESRGSSPEQGGFSLANLLPWKSAKHNTFKDARERRREEIERSSISNLGEAWRSQDPNQYQYQYQYQNQNTQPPSWGWPPATRYA